MLRHGAAKVRHGGVNVWHVARKLRHVPGKLYTGGVKVWHAPEKLGNGGARVRQEAMKRAPQSITLVVQFLAACSFR